MKHFVDILWDQKKKPIMDTPQITAFLPALCNAVASTNANVRTAGLSALDDLVAGTEPSPMIQSLASLLSTGTNVKARITLIVKLTGTPFLTFFIKNREKKTDLLSNSHLL